MKKKNDENILQLLRKEIEPGIEVPYLSFNLLNSYSWLSHGFSTREGGVSKGIFSSMNLSLHRGDEKDDVLENYRRITKALGFTTYDVVTSDQTHTTNVRLVTAKDKGKGVLFPLDYRDVDGLITNEPGVLLTTFYADCVPLFFVDPVHKAIGLSHSGWKGTVNGMGLVTIQKMMECFGSNPSDLICAIGPSICMDCYEISGDVANQFIDKFPSYDNKLLIAKENDKYQLNLWEANYRILRSAGVLEEHIATTNICTCCNPNTLFSHRASKGKRGNLAAFMGIKA